MKLARTALLLLAPLLADAGRSIAQTSPSGPATESIQNNPLALWYRTPARVWADALAIGTGRLGATLFDDPQHDRFQINEITVWSGGPMPNADRPGAYKALPAP